MSELAIASTNAALVSSGVAKPKPGGKTPSSPVADKAPVVAGDSVELTTGGKAASKATSLSPINIAGFSGRPLFDPTAGTKGPFEVKHIGGQLATSSAKDGYNGWEAMLQYCFGIENGGDRNDMPVWTYTSLSQSVGNGRIPGNFYTNEERNLIANAFVYCHDNGISEDGAESLASGILDFRYDFHEANQGSREDLYKTVWDSPDYPADAFPPATSAEDEVIAQRILSSKAFEDNVLPKEVIRSHVHPGSGGPYNLGYHDSLVAFEKLVYAYSPSGSDGSARPDAAQSVEIQARLAYNAQRQARENQVKAGLADGSIKPSAPPPPLGTYVNGVRVDGGGGQFDPEALKTKDYLGERLGGIVGSLSKDQAGFLNALYKVASKKGETNGHEMKKVDALARAMVTQNFAEAFFSKTINQAKTSEQMLGSIMWQPKTPTLPESVLARLNKPTPTAPTAPVSAPLSKPTANTAVAQGTTTTGPTGKINTTA